jgi:hypothetical protein
MTQHGHGATGDNLTATNDQARREDNHPPARLG